MNDMTNWWGGGGGPCPPPACSPSPLPPGAPPWFSPQAMPCPTLPWFPGANAGVSFGTTFPQNPVRGHFLWDGEALWLFDGVGWQQIGPETAPDISAGIPEAPIDGNLYGRENASWVNVTEAVAASGTGAATTTEVFAIGCPANLTIGASASAWTAVPFTAAPTIDPQGGWNAATHKLTPNKPGFYLFMARSFSGGVAGMALVKNDPGTFTGNLASEETTLITSTGATGWMMAGGISQMNGSTDFVRLFAYDTTSLFYSTGANPVLRSYLLP